MTPEQRNSIKGIVVLDPDVRQAGDGGTASGLPIPAEADEVFWAKSASNRGIPILMVLSAADYSAASGAERIQKDAFYSLVTDLNQKPAGQRAHDYIANASDQSLQKVVYFALHPVYGNGPY
jgi:hypothetical protein